LAAPFLIFEIFFLKDNKKESAPHHLMSGALSFRKLLSAWLLALSETLLELSYATAGIKNSLLACVEGMTYGTYFNVDRSSFLGATGCKYFTATASYFGLHICWVDFCLHFYFFLF
jgi:hypothetical protein